MKLLLYSGSDPAGVSISSKLCGMIPFKDAEIGALPAKAYGDCYLIEIRGSLVDFDLNLEGVEWALCLSRHKSSSGMVCLTAHTPGNPGLSADLGGSPNSVAIANPPLQSDLIRSLKSECSRRGIEVPVTVEATHHGPTDLEYPVTFVEIGSDETSWTNPVLGEIVASAVSSTLSPSGRNRNAVGLGGGHYSEKFTRLILSGEFDFGHIIPKYVLAGDYDPSIVQKCLLRTAGGVRYVVADWKGMPSRAKEALRQALPSLGVELVRV